MNTNSKGRSYSSAANAVNVVLTVIGEIIILGKEYVRSRKKVESRKMDVQSRILRP